MSRRNYMEFDHESVPVKTASRPLSSLQQLSAILTLTSFGALVFSFIAVTCDYYVGISVENYFYTEEGSAETHLLVPQADVSLGVSVYCFSNRCASRSTLEGPLSLVPNVTAFENTTLVNNTALMDSLQEVYHQFVFGYDVGASCGTAAGAVKSLSLFALASNIIETLALVVTAFVGVILFHLFCRVNVLLGEAAVNCVVKDVVVGERRISAVYLLRELKAQMKFERPLVIVLLVSTAVSFVFSLFAMAGSAALVAGKMKCGKSFCKSFTSAFESLESALGTQSENKYNCSIGASLPTIIVSFLLSLIAVVAAALLGLVYVKSSRMELLSKRRDQLVSLQNELNVKLGSLNASCAAPLEATSEDFSNHPDSFAYSNPSGFNESNLRPSTDDVNPQHLEETKINKLGGRIALFKQRRILEAEEQSRRETIMAEEERRFHMRERQFQLSHRLHNLEGQ